MKQEIIEIGMTELNLITLQTTQEASHFVRPKRWEISSKCTYFTGITTDDIRQACSFPKVLESLTEQFAPSRALWCTWGNDASLIAATCQAHGLKTLLRNLLDLSQLFQCLFQLKQRASLQNAVEVLGMGFDGFLQSAIRGMFLRSVRLPRSCNGHFRKGSESPPLRCCLRRFMAAPPTIHTTFLVGHPALS
jgi:inhibitor of KinA sporulation pathway (predicted exonuclease)